MTPAFDDGPQGGQKGLVSKGAVGSAVSLPRGVKNGAGWREVAV